MTISHGYQQQDHLLDQQGTCKKLQYWRIQHHLELIVSTHIHNVDHGTHVLLVKPLKLVTIIIGAFNNGILIAGDHFNRRRIVMVLNIDRNRSKSLSLIHYDILLIYHQSSGLTDVSIQLFQQSTGQVDIPPINTISSRILVLRRSTGLDEKITGYIDNTSCWITISSSW